MKKKNEVAVKQTDYLAEIKNTQELCAMLMKQPYFARMGQDGVFAITTVARALDINPIKALMGGLYFVKGRVEMTYTMMGELIRNKGHSLSSKSDEKSCTVHGKRKDNGDTASFTFTIEDAKKAGIYKNAWITYPKNMLYARALSSLARQLFPDVIGNSYVEGEIKDDPNIADQNDSQNDNQIEHKKISEPHANEVQDKRTDEEIKTLTTLLKDLPDESSKLNKFLKVKNIEMSEIPKPMYENMIKKAKKKAFDKLKEEVKSGPNGEFYHDAYFGEEVQYANPGV